MKKKEYKRFGLLGFILTCLLACSAIGYGAQSGSPVLKTLSNLNIALRGETNASHRYELFAKKADEEGYLQVSKLFRAVSMSESIHRNNHKATILSMKGIPEVIQYAKVNVQTTRQNLEGPVKGEVYEKDVLYPDFIRQAKRDHASLAVKSFQDAQLSEAQHDKLFEKALKELGHNKPVDYCISPTTGATVEIPISQLCPREPVAKKAYIRVR